MTFAVRASMDRDVREFAAWRYAASYDAYNVDMEPDAAVAYFLDPDVHCFSIVDDDEVVGFCTFGRDAQVPGGDYSADALDIGLGVRPDRTGAGTGHLFVAATIAHAYATFGPRFDPRQLGVTIAAGNTRAVRAWSNAGFVEVSRFATSQELMGSREFSVLLRQSASSTGR